MGDLGFGLTLGFRMELLWRKILDLSLKLS
jgi:hypothetical protein